MIKRKIQQQLRRFYTKNSSGGELTSLIGLGRFEFERYIDKLMLEGMDRINFGKIWELDHIVPVTLFNLDDINDLKLCYNYQNLMPMFIQDNKYKGSSIHFSIEILNNLKQTDIVKDLLNLCIKEKESRYGKYIR